MGLPNVSVSVSGQRARRAMPWECFVTIASKDVAKRQWVRLGYIIGPASSSHRGHWRTKVGTLRGHNFRVGAPVGRRCLTMIAHTRRPRR